MNKKKSFKCLNCGREWQDYISNDKNKKFCSVHCKSAYSRIERECKKCHKVFTICESVLKTNATGNYCSRECYVEKMRTGLVNHKNGFRGISRRMRRRPQFCAICGTFRRIHIHHIEPYRYTKNNSKENLIPLCVKHHKVVEIQTENLLEADDNQNRVFSMMQIMLRSRQQQTLHTIKICKQLI